MNPSGHFVADGGDRLIRASIARIRSEVAERYAEELEQAGILRRWRLRRRIEREIRRELEHLAPPDALFATCSPPFTPSDVANDRD
ncbi:MAG: hypothetical protein V3T70_05340 [Phycisphaerae bacterium]